MASSDGHSGRRVVGDPRVDTRGIHRRGGLTIDNRRCISFDLPNIAKKPLTVHRGHMAKSWEYQ